MFIFSFTVKTRPSFWWHVKDKCSLQTAFCHQWKGQHISSTYLFVNETLNFVFKFSNSLSTFQWNNQWISLAANFNIVIPYLITKSYKYLMSFWSCVLVKLETSLLMHSWLQSHWWKTWLINDAVKISHMKTFIIFKFHQSNILPIKQFKKKNQQGFSYCWEFIFNILFLQRHKIMINHELSFWNAIQQVYFETW